MAAVTVGQREKNDQSMVPWMPFTSPHQRLECTATHSILAAWFNPFSCLTNSEHCIHHHLHAVSSHCHITAHLNALTNTVHLGRTYLIKLSHVHTSKHKERWSLLAMCSHSPEQYYSPSGHLSSKWPSWLSASVIVKPFTPHFPDGSEWSGLAVIQVNLAGVTGLQPTVSSQDSPPDCCLDWDSPDRLSQYVCVPSSCRQCHYIHITNIVKLFSDVNTFIT